ncbi:pseudouridine synthase [Deinococcus maricopensis]|uniref:Pseudouridine synthase n=1 Tax=Deinococcus maricopensis (strain DSM 21211 / LMG 22137 / NRRL B-23946 / LB-34) TaxID=709986 RepID=E8U9I7_DEIML|nr:pseudouridine synthase [Deinococcus maricopensis]ADV67726.1 pseudouridine synthase Rsu [Deinococcus maricopensis DSM 21211]
MTERLQKRLARAGVASRRAAEALITSGRVTVNGVTAQLGQTVTEADEVLVDGQPIAQRPTQHVTFALYKPRGFVTTARDELGRRTVLDAMPNVPGLHPVGRLDRDSEGLLLLTTDGDLTLTLTHPRYGHEKVYRAWTDGQPDEAALGRLARGMNLEDGPTGPAEVRAAPDGAWVTIREGRNRQVRRMLDAVGYPVTRLVRTRVGGLWLEDLGPGEYRELDERALQELLNVSLVPHRVRERLDLEMLDRWH